MSTKISTKQDDQVASDAAQTYCLTADAELAIKSRRANGDGSAPNGLISVEEYVALLRALEQGMGGGFTEAEANKVEAWAERVRLEFTALEMVLQGDFIVKICPDGGVAFGKPRKQTSGTTPATVDEVNGATSSGPS